MSKHLRDVLHIEVLISYDMFDWYTLKISNYFMCKLFFPLANYDSI